MSPATVIGAAFALSAILGLVWAARRLFSFMDSSDALLATWKISVEKEKTFSFYVKRLLIELGDSEHLLLELAATLQKALSKLEDGKINIDGMLAVRKARKEVAARIEEILGDAINTEDNQSALPILYKNISQTKAEIETAKANMTKAIDDFSRDRQRFPASLLYAD